MQPLVVICHPELNLSNQTMKRRNLLFLMWAAVASISVHAQSDANQPYVTKTFTSAKLNALVVETSGGSISVIGGESSTGFKVEMFVKPNNWNGERELSKEEVEERLEDYDILIGTEGNKVVATAKRINRQNQDNRNGIFIAFKIYAPRQVSSELKTSGGSIQISSLSGNQYFTTSGGSLSVNDLNGIIKGRTSGGSITVTNCSKEIDLSTSGGSISASRLNGTINLRTSGGSITMNQLSGAIQAHTSGGSVKGDGFKGALDAGTSGGSVKLARVSGSLKASTSAGSIDVELATLGEYLSLSTSAGNVRVRMPLDKGVDLNLKGRQVSIPLKNFDGSAGKDRVNGKMNGGGVPVSLSASGGGVYVNQ
jgi:hypothetical protein